MLLLGRRRLVKRMSMIWCVSYLVMRVLCIFPSKNAADVIGI